MAPAGAIFIAFPCSVIILKAAFLSDEYWVNIVILGPGAIGSLWAIKLKAAGHHVSVWATSQQSQFSFQLDQQAVQHFSNRNIDHVQQADLILVTVKAWQVSKALMPLLPYIDSDAMIMLMHNGMGSAEHVEQMFTANPILLATTTHGAYKPNRQQVRHTGQGQTQLGGYNLAGKQCDFIAAVFEHALPKVNWNKTIQDALWIKLAINCVINPLTALEKVNNGQLANAPYQQKIEQLLDEIYPVLRAENVPITRLELAQTVSEVIEATAENYSSMEQDIAHQRHSEIDFITGYLLKRAAYHNISAPYNRKLYQAIKQIEQSWKS